MKRTLYTLSQIRKGEPPTGTAIAKASESFNGGDGLIKALIFGR